MVISKCEYGRSEGLRLFCIPTCFATEFACILRRYSDVKPRKIAVYGKHYCRNVSCDDRRNVAKTDLNRKRPIFVTKLPRLKPILVTWQQCRFLCTQNTPVTQPKRLAPTFIFSFPLLSLGGIMAHLPTRLGIVCLSASLSSVSSSVRTYAPHRAMRGANMRHAFIQPPSWASHRRRNHCDLSGPGGRGSLRELYTALRADVATEPRWMCFEPDFKVAWFHLSTLWGFWFDSLVFYCIYCTIRRPEESRKNTVTPELL